MRVARELKSGSRPISDYNYIQSTTSSILAFARRLPAEHVALAVLAGLRACSVPRIDGLVNQVENCWLNFDVLLCTRLPVGVPVCLRQPPTLSGLDEAVVFEVYFVSDEDSRNACFGVFVETLYPVRYVPEALFVRK